MDWTVGSHPGQQGAAKGLPGGMNTFNGSFLSPYTKKQKSLCYCISEDSTNFKGTVFQRIRFIPAEKVLQRKTLEGSRRYQWGGVQHVAKGHPLISSLQILAAQFRWG